MSDAKPTPTTFNVADFFSEIPTSDKGNLACPFCGHTKLSLIASKKEPHWSWVQCDTCGATGPNLGGNVTWNTRAFGENLYFRSQDADQLKTILEGPL